MKKRFIYEYKEDENGNHKVNFDIENLSMRETLGILEELKLSLYKHMNNIIDKIEFEENK